MHVPLLDFPYNDYTCFICVAAHRNPYPTAGARKHCNASQADIVFLMDASGSEGPDNFNKQKEFVANFSSAFNIGPRDIQISVMTFSTTVYSESRLNEHNNKHDLLMAIDRVRQT